MLQNLINHVVFVIDRSGSMSHLSSSVVKVFDAQIAYLKKRSEELNQETRASVYLFDDTTSCLVYDMDVMRVPSLAGHYRVNGSTGLLDATGLAIDELKQTAQLHGDHAFLVYVLTDGGENCSRNVSVSDLKKRIDALADNWTLGVLVPDANGTRSALSCGFSDGNIQIWSTDAKGFAEAAQAIQKSTENFFVARSKGVRGTKSLFKTVDLADLSTKTVTSVLDVIPQSKYTILNVKRDSAIRDFIEHHTGKYVTGSGYYQLTKTEEVQAYKEMAIQHLKTGKVYGGDNARKLLGLGKVTTKVKPGDFGEYELFIQSTSVNRKLISGTKVLVMS